MIIPDHIAKLVINLMAPYVEINAKDVNELIHLKRTLLKIKDAARLLGLSRMQISRLAQKGEIKKINVGIGKKLYRITPESIDEFIRRGGISEN